jgi:hydrogenase maturation protein HypF
VGRLFDAAASLMGIRDRVSHEGQAAIELEWLAAEVRVEGAYPFELVSTGEGGLPLTVDTRPLVRAVVRNVVADVEPPRIARLFQSTLVAIIAAVCARLRKATGIDTVVLSGGVFLNALLTVEATGRLVRDGFRVHRHRLVPPNDGGLSLGQLAVAAACLR